MGALVAFFNRLFDRKDLTYSFDFGTRNEKLFKGKIKLLGYLLPRSFFGGIGADVHRLKSG